MLHVREWSVERVSEASEAAKKIKANTYVDCYGVQIGAVIFINDSTDCGIREFAVIDATRNIQIDSWTIDWMSDQELVDDIKILLVEYSNYQVFPTFNKFEKSMICFSLNDVDFTEQQLKEMDDAHCLIHPESDKHYLAND